MEIELSYPVVAVDIFSRVKKQQRTIMVWHVCNVRYMTRTWYLARSHTRSNETQSWFSPTGSEYNAERRVYSLPGIIYGKIGDEMLPTRPVSFCVQKIGSAIHDTACVGRPCYSWYVSIKYATDSRSTY